MSVIIHNIAMSPPEAYIQMLAPEANIGKSEVVGQVYLSERGIHNVRCPYAAIFHHDRTCVLPLCAGLWQTAGCLELKPYTWGT